MPKNSTAQALINGASTTSTIGNGVFQDRGINYTGAYEGSFPALRNTGDNTAHNIQQPYQVVHCWKRIS